jgi:two-component system phosphate regulon response regulator OmpR
VDIHVTRLRKKLEADPKNPRYLQTVRGVGYMLSPDE